MSIEPGTYKAQVSDYYWENRDNPPLIIWVVVRNEWNEQAKVRGAIWFSEKASGMARAQLRALGVDPDNESQMNQLFATTLPLIGRDVQVEVDWNEYKGKRYLQVSRFGSVKAPPSAKAQTAIKERLRAAKKQKPPFPDINAMPMEEPPQAAAESATITPLVDPPATDESDIPF